MREHSDTCRSTLAKEAEATQTQKATKEQVDTDSIA